MWGVQDIPVKTNMLEYWAFSNQNIGTFLSESFLISVRSGQDDSQFLISRIVAQSIYITSRS